MKKICYLAITAAALMCSCGARSQQEFHPAVVDSVSERDADTLAVPDTLTFAMVGDIMMGTTYPEEPAGAYLPADSGRHLFDDAVAVLRRADLALGNQEGVLLDGPGERRRPGRNPKTYFVFRTPTNMVRNLVDAGIDFMGMANNHVNDFGESGRLSTMKTLREAGIAYAGLKGRCEVAVLECSGLKIAVTQFSHGMGTLDINSISELQRVVRQMRDTADLVVVAFHGGAEGTGHLHVPHAAETYVGEARGNVERFAHAAIDAGAALVYGHGPHVPRAAELYKGHFIIYSLGNFCTPYRMGIAGYTGLAPIAEVKIDPHTGRFLSGRIHSLRQQRGIGPRLDATNGAATLISSLSREDFPASPLRISGDGEMSVAP